MRSNPLPGRARALCLAFVATASTIACAVTTPAPSQPRLTDGVSYCGDDIELISTGIVCVDPVSEVVARKREVSFKLTHKAGKVVRIDRFGGGRDTVWERWELDYEGDQLREERLSRGSGDLRYRGVFERGGRREVFRDARGEPLLHWPGDDVSAFNVAEMTYGEHGFLATKRFMTVAGNRGKDQKGVHEYRYRKNEHGHTLEVAAFDERGKPITMGSGVHKRVQTYRNSQIVARARFDVAGRPLASEEEGAHETIVRDADGNARVVRQLDAEKRLLKEEVNRYDDGGRLVERKTITPARKSAADAGDTEIASFDYLSNGFLSRIARRSADPETTDIAWDPKGQIAGIRWFGADDKLTGAKAMFRDEAGELVREVFGDEADRVTRFEDMTRDEQGRLLKRSYYTAAGELDLGRPCPTLQYLYDGDGFNARVVCIAESGAIHDVIVYRLLVVEVDDQRGRTKDVARARAEEANARLRAGERIVDLVPIFDTRSFKEPPIERRLLRVDVAQTRALWRAVQALEVGANTGVIEDDKSFSIGWRER